MHSVEQCHPCYINSSPSSCISYTSDPSITSVNVVVTIPPVTSTHSITSVVITSTQDPPTTDQIPSILVLAGAVSGVAAILLVMIVSTLVVILILKKKRTRDKAAHSDNSCTGLSNNMCVVYCSAYNDFSLFISCVGVYTNTPGFDSHMQTGKENLYSE